MVNDLSCINKTSLIMKKIIKQLRYELFLIGAKFRIMEPVSKFGLIGIAATLVLASFLGVDLGK